MPPRKTIDIETERKNMENLESIAKTKSGAKKPTVEEKEVDERLSLRQLEKEINDLVLFYATISYLKVQLKYRDRPNEKYMTLEDFKKKVDEVSHLKIYKEKK